VLVTPARQVYSRATRFSATRPLARENKGPTQECDHAARLLGETLNVVSVSNPYPIGTAVAWSAPTSRSVSSLNASRPSLPAAATRHVPEPHCTAPTGSCLAADLSAPMRRVRRYLQKRRLLGCFAQPGISQGSQSKHQGRSRTNGSSALLSEEQRVGNRRKRLSNC
jgi:hypothetical protein